MADNNVLILVSGTGVSGIEPLLPCEVDDYVWIADYGDDRVVHILCDDTAKTTLEADDGYLSSTYIGISNTTIKEACMKCTVSATNPLYDGVKIFPEYTITRLSISGAKERGFVEGEFIETNIIPFQYPEVDMS